MSADKDATPVLQVSDLSVAFRNTEGWLCVVDGLNLELARGEVLALVGESGCGKTMTALGILGLLPDNARATAAHIIVNGRQLELDQPRTWVGVRGREIGFIPQDSSGALDPVFTIGTQLTAVLRLHARCTRAEAKRRGLELLERVQLGEPIRTFDSYPHQLSGGMRQRVAIALALAGGPAALIADEPTTALDASTRLEIAGLLRALQREQHLAVLLISHDFGLVSQLAARIAVMYAGRIVEEGSLAEILTSAIHPYTQALLAAAPAWRSAQRTLADIPGQVPSPGNWPVGCRFAPRCPIALDVCREQDAPQVRQGETHSAWCHAAATDRERR